MGGVSNINTQKLYLAISQSCSRFLKCKCNLQDAAALRIFDEKVQSTPQLMFAIKLRNSIRIVMDS
jgi:hypothetical protein